jgi:hypothetical protein
MIARQLGLGILAVGMAAAVLTTEAHGQYTPYYRPGNSPYMPGGGGAISPYLNLLRGTNPAVNYYLGVRSEVERRQALQMQLLGQERANLIVEQPSTEDVFQKLGGTGHPAVFQNYGSYYSFGGTPSGQLNPLGTVPRIKR